MLTHFLTFQSACLRHMQIRFASVLFIGVVSCGACPSFGQAVLEQPVAPTAGQQVAPPVSEAMPSKTPAGPAKSSAASLARLTNDTRYLASDELAGRQPGTPEMQLAVDFIVKQYQEAGVKGAAEDGSYFQAVPVEGNQKIEAAKTRMAFAGPDGQTLKLILGETFTSLIARKSNSIQGDLMFVGYGIAAKEHNYNEYLDVDVKDKVVVMIRREPQQNSADSVFDGQDTSEHSFIVSKIRAARAAKAAGIILVNDSGTAFDDEADQLVQSGQFGAVSFPFYQMKRATLNEMLVASPMHTPTGKKLATLEQAEEWIDSKLEPISQPIKGWSVDAGVEFSKPNIDTSNLIAVIPGQGKLAEETVIVGAHYDHIGRGAYGSRTPGRKEIHNGADDNATGTAAVIELARRFSKRAADETPRRRLVLICFTAEEMGLLGARHYVSEPLFDLDSTVAMVNFDMIGSLRNDELTIYNWNTSPQFSAMLNTANEPLGLELKLPPAAFAGSDHLPFNQFRIPNMFIHTGLTDTYHTPDDTFETMNCEGILKTVDFSQGVLEQLLTSPRPKYGTPRRFTLGIQLDREGGKDGVQITKVVKDSVAEAAGIEAGDWVMSIDDDPISRRRDLVRRIRRDAGKTVNLKVRRGEEEIDFTIELKNKS